MDQNVDFSGADQIQNPQYPDIHPLSQENPLTNGKFEAYTNADDAYMNNLQLKFDNFQKNQQDFQKKFEQKQDDFQNQMRNFMQNLHDGPPEVPEKQNKSMEDTMLELVKICQEKEFLCIHDDVNDLIESALNSKLLLINLNSQRLEKKQQEVKNIVEQPAERGNRKPEHLLSMWYEHLSITPERESDEVTESNAENLLPIPSKCEVTLEDKRKCDLPISENSPIYDNHSDIFSDSKIDDDILVYDDDFEDIEYVKALLSDPEIVSEEENDADLFLAADNAIPPGIENFADDPEGGIRFLEELLIDDSILYHESSDSNFEDNPLIPRPPPEPLDAETDAGEEILVVMKEKDEDIFTSFDLKLAWGSPYPLIYIA
nr:hypothetical protein [Tanacetum cinerariifolium]